MTTVIKPPVGCPQCYSDNVDYDNYDFWGDGTSTQEASCQDCQCGWQEVYHFNRIEIQEDGVKKDDNDSTKERPPHVELGTRTLREVPWV